jgi:hypothetical protein
MRFSRTHVLKCTSLTVVIMCLLGCDTTSAGDSERDVMMQTVALLAGASGSASAEQSSLADYKENCDTPYATRCIGWLPGSYGCGAIVSVYQVCVYGYWRINSHKCGPC